MFNGLGKMGVSNYSKLILISQSDEEIEIDCYKLS